MAKNREQSIEFWKKQYYHCKNQVDRIDKGETIIPDSVVGISVGQRTHCVDEANIAVDRLAKFRFSDLPKIK